MLNPHTVDNHFFIQEVVCKADLDAFQLGLPSQNIDSIRTKLNHVFFLHLGFKTAVGEQTVVQYHFDLRKQELSSVCDQSSLLGQGVVLQLSDEHQGKTNDAPDGCHQLVRDAGRNKRHHFGLLLC